MSNPLSPKARMQIPRQAMPEQEAAERSHNFEEVNLGLDDAIARQEALRRRWGPWASAPS